MLTQAIGLPPLKYSACTLATMRGDQVQIDALWDSGMRSLEARGEGSAFGMYFRLTALLNNSRGQYGAALVAARRGCEYEDVMAYGWNLVELVEAAVRDGRSEEATAALDRLCERTEGAGTEWALSGSKSARGALLSDDEASYRESVERLSRSHAAVELARSQLIYGEWLRRDNRRMEARDLLRAADESFSHMGADAFAERARRELLAIGETAHRRTEDTRDALTPQELQVARLARDGFSNSEIGGQMFISPRTVEYHLHKVFRKLDVSSRGKLRDALRGEPPRFRTDPASALRPRTTRRNRACRCGPRRRASARRHATGSRSTARWGRTRPPAGRRWRRTVVEPRRRCRAPRGRRPRRARRRALRSRSSTIAAPTSVTATGWDNPVDSRTLSPSAPASTIVGRNSKNCVARTIVEGTDPATISSSWATLARRYPLSGRRSAPTTVNARW